jgi:hypothetical protein
MRGKEVFFEKLISFSAFDILAEHRLAQGSTRIVMN